MIEVVTSSTRYLIVTLEDLSAAESIDVDKEDLKCEDNLEEATRNPMLMIVAFQATEV